MYLLNKILAYKFFLMPIVLLFSLPSFAQNANQEADRIQLQQDIRLQQRTREVLGDRSQSRLQVEKPAPVVGREGRCIDIQNIDIIGSDLLPSEKSQKIESEFENKCLNVGDIEKLISKLTSYFIENGYTTTRAYLPPQDLTTGNLIIEVVDGKVESIIVEDEGYGAINASTVFNDIEGDYFNIWRFEQGLEQVNRLRRNNATLEIEPSQKTGHSVVKIRNTPRNPIYATFGLNNTGIESTGRYQASAAINAEGLLGLNEFFNYTKTTSLPIKKDKKFTESDLAIFSIPFGKSLFTFVYSENIYESKLIQTGNIFELSGRTQNISADISHVVYRDQTDILRINAGITQKKIRNYFEDQLLNVSSRKLVIVDVGVDYSTELWRGLLGLNFEYSKGIKALGALEDANGISDSIPRAQFDRFKLGFNYIKAFLISGEMLNFNTNFQSQYSLNHLYGSEQFLVGGPYSVRGYLNESIANDYGFISRNEVVWNDALKAKYNKDKRLILSLSPYLGFDLGGVSGDVAKTPNGMLTGAFIGVRSRIGEFTVDFSLSQGISAPSEIKDEDLVVFLNMSKTL
jgi:hemolysin activation/secretion protein